MTIVPGGIVIEGYGERESFDPLDQACLHDLLGNDLLADPVLDLMKDLDEYEKISGSFGVSWIKTAEMLDRVMKNLKDLRSALKEEHRNQL